jgi:hypothetical protein
MGYKRTSLLLASSLPLLVSFVPLSLATSPQTPTPTWKTPPITDTQSLRELAVQVLENASLERNFPLQTELQTAFALEADVTSAANIGALILSFIGWWLNSSREAALHPWELFSRILNVLSIMSRTGTINKLAILLTMMYMHPKTVKQTATIQAKFANCRRADCAIQEAITEEMKRNLLADSKRYLNFSTAAYGIPQIWASQVMQPSAMYAEDITQTIAANTTKIIAGQIAHYLGISEDQILYLTPLDAPLTDSYHFVAIDNHANSVVLAIRGTYSVSELCDDARASTGT